MINHKDSNLRQKISTILLLTLSCLGIVFLFPDIPQDPAYHQFADQRTGFGITNFWNVITNLPFPFIGLLGLYLMTKKGILKFPNTLFINYAVFFSGIFLVGFGSAYYHLTPDNNSLVWDRLPMTLAFMAFFSIIIGEYISEKTGQLLLFPLLVTGLYSVLYWHYTEMTGAGDLRLYALVQFLPMLLIPLIIIMFQPQYSESKYLWLMMGAYLIAKVFELGDQYIYQITGLISGHAIKHLAAALAPVFLIMGLNKRVRIV